MKISTAVELQFRVRLSVILQINCMNGVSYTFSLRKITVQIQYLPCRFATKSTSYKKDSHHYNNNKHADSWYRYLLTECARERVEPLEALSARVGRRMLAARLSSTLPSSSSSPLLRPSTRQPRLPAWVRSTKFIWAPVHTQLYSLAEIPQLPPYSRLWAQIRGGYWSAKIDDISL
jgi:hypothetical protein